MALPSYIDFDEPTNLISAYQKKYGSNRRNKWKKAEEDNKNGDTNGPCFQHIMGSLCLCLCAQVVAIELCNSSLVFPGSLFLKKVNIAIILLGQLYFIIV